ncbi:gp436 family protein [Roseateles sp. DXS20W]|uniref:Gp436 family protein n=1 Tax=Pelomonas lactea TaxID=3299030 RepID=A0ABW7GJY6_9BURK
MPYVTTQHLIDRFGQAELIQVTNAEDPAATTVNATRVTNAVADIGALIDAKLAARYALPLATVPLVLLNVAADLVRARLYDDRIPDRLADREKAALKLLDQIAEGTLSLGLDAAAQPTPPSDGPQYFSGRSVFTADSLSDYAP